MTSPTGSRLTDAQEVLLRQVHPKQRPGGVVSSEAFKPNATDAGLLSTLRGAVAPAEAYRRWIEEEKRLSVGTYGVSVEEVDGRGLAALDDAAAMAKPDHASVDFTALPSGGRVKQAARQLRDLAVQRGSLYEPSTQD